MIYNIEYNKHKKIYELIKNEELEYFRNQVAGHEAYHFRLFLEDLIENYYTNIKDYHPDKKIPLMTLAEVDYYKKLNENEQLIYETAYGYNISHKLTNSTLEEVLNWGYDIDMINKQFLIKTKLRGKKDVRNKYY
jgi:hypothetical protein